MNALVKSSFEELDKISFHNSNEGFHEIKFTLELWRDVPIWELVIGFKNILIQRRKEM
jgi:hypothetical protein